MEAGRAAERASQYTRSTLTVGKSNYTVSRVDPSTRTAWSGHRYGEFAAVKGVWTAMRTEAVDAAEKPDGPGARQSRVQHPAGQGSVHAEFLKRQ